VTEYRIAVTYGSVLVEVGCGAWNGRIDEGCDGVGKKVVVEWKERGSVWCRVEEKMKYSMWCYGRKEVVCSGRTKGSKRYSGRKEDVRGGV
jgi:hypothetical protein